MKDKIVVVGGSGFVGSRFISDHTEKYEITNIDKNQSPFFPEITKLVDIRDYQGLCKAFTGCKMVVLLAAEHRDDVEPLNLYYDVNVKGTENVLRAMDENGINNIIFTSSVAVYGMNRISPNEESEIAPFNEYGNSKWEAEKVLSAWLNQNPKTRSLTIIRPTVIFGERNRGNVYNLLKQIVSGRFVMIGDGKNKKSMAYVGNVSKFIDYCIGNLSVGKHLYNYVDQPDLSMNDLLQLVCQYTSKRISRSHIPIWIGMLGGYGFDVLRKFTGKKFSISSIRVKKFCATTQFDAQKAHSQSFAPPYDLKTGLKKTLEYEFGENENSDRILFFTE